MSVIQDIYEVFVDFFGSQNVDLQEYTEFEETRYKILVFWDTVTVTNELGKSIDIWNLYAKIHLKSNGSLIYSRPHFIRSCYNDAQWNSRYLHSHVQQRYRVDNFFEWAESPCLGSGPINRTIDNLRYNPDFYTDMDYWMLFCVELDKYVHVESISGVPYIKMSCVGANTNNSVYELYESNMIPTSSLNTSTVIDFINYILHNPSIFKFSYHDGRYNLGLPFVDLIKAVTNEFLNWYYADEKHIKGEQSTKILISKGILRKCYIKYNYIVYESDLTSTLDANIGRSLGFEFKGHPVTMSKKDNVNNSNNKSLILNPEIIGVIVYKVLTLVNFKYGQNVSEETDTNGAVQRFL